MKIGITLQGDLAAMMDAERKAGAAAVTRGIRIAARGLEKDLEAATEAGGLGRLSRAWASQVYPKGKDSLGAAGIVYGKGGERTVGALLGHSRDTVIRAAGRRFLAIPTDSVPRRRGRRGGGDRMTPGEVETHFNADLHLIVTPRGKLLLVLKAIASSRSRSGFRAAVRRRGGRNVRVPETALVPMFVLIPQARLRKRYDIDGPVQRWRDRLPGLILNEWNRAA